MPDLVISFEGMALFVNGPDRSEALFADTNKMQTRHSHLHLLKLGIYEVILEDALVWFEQNGRRLSATLTGTPDWLISLDEVCAGDDLSPALASPDPETNLEWLGTHAAWMRLPGGAIDTTRTSGAGGRAEWTFAMAGGKEKVTPLTQNVTVTKALKSETDTIELVVRRFGSYQGENPVRYPVPAVKNGWAVSVITRFIGHPDPSPVPGSKVRLDEVQLLYSCLKSGGGPVPFTIWPALVPNEDRALGTRSDPATGICPPGKKELEP